MYIENSYRVLPENLVTMRTPFISIWVFLLSGCYTCEEAIKVTYIDKSISGTIVKSKHSSVGNKSGYLVIKEGPVFGRFVIDNEDETSLIKLAEIGDSLYKEKGDQYLHIYRNGILVKKYDVWNECKYAR
jgi:hypothetical protein